MKKAPPDGDAWPFVKTSYIEAIILTMLPVLQPCLFGLLLPRS